MAQNFSCMYAAAADTSSGQSQQAANIMPQYMQLLNQMGTEYWLSAFSNSTGNSGLLYISVLSTYVVCSLEFVIV